MSEQVNHPGHYGGGENPFEARKLIRDWGLGFNLGNVLKYVYRFRQKNGVQDLEKAHFYIRDAIEGGREQLVFEWAPRKINVGDVIRARPISSLCEDGIFRALHMAWDVVGNFTDVQLMQHLVGIKLAIELLIAQQRDETKNL